MEPTNFPEANTRFGPPEGMAESQVKSIKGFSGKVEGGALDGSLVTVVAWIPSDEDVDRIMAGEPIFLTMIGGLAPHFITTSFKEATGL